MATGALAVRLASATLQAMNITLTPEQELSALGSDIEAGWEDAEAGRLLNGPQTMASLLQRARERVDARADEPGTHTADT